MKRNWFSGFMVACSLAAGLSITCAAQETKNDGMTVVTSDKIDWKDYPGLPGIKVAVLYGDPKQEGVYIVRAKFAPHTMSRPHWHPEARYVTVISGTWWAGTGDSFDPELTVPLAPGSFVVHTPREVHYDGAKDEEVVVEIMGIGPSGTNVVEINGSKIK